MGGSGSGRSGWWRKMGSFLTLDIRYLIREGLRPGAQAEMRYGNAD
jgi:hypothetical protein